MCSILRLLLLANLIAVIALSGEFAWSQDKAGAAVETPVVAAFVSASDDFQAADKNLRKWETPTVADLDQDGWVDLLLNDHGLSVQVVWNNKGAYSKPWDILMGDMHGIAVGDFDQDGLLEVAIARGGGSGSNARNSAIFKVGKDRSFTRMAEFNTPLAMMRGRTVKFVDADGDGDLDLLNFAFPSQEKLGESENYVYENTGHGNLVLHSTLPPSHSDGQKVLLTDFDNDGFEDILMYGHRSLRIFRSNKDLSFGDVSAKVLGMSIDDITGITALDFDNDGDLDLYIGRGREMRAGDTFYDAQTETWGFFTKRGKFQFEDLVIGDVLKIENYQSPWPNMKLFTGEPAIDYKFPGETFSGKDIRLVSSDALGWPDHLTNKGLFVGYVGNQRWRLAGETWSPMTAVIHGVKSASATGIDEGPEDILLENRNGRFVDISKQAGISLKQHTTGVVAADLDNNGFEDLVAIPRGNLVAGNEAVIWLNRGEGRFEAAPFHGVYFPELGAIGLGVESLDYNRDGKMDLLVGNERGNWHLFRNQITTSGNYLTVDLGMAGENKAARLGATVTVEACGQKQTRRSGSSGAPYSRTFNRYVQFGLGNCSGPAVARLTLSNGETLQKKNVSVNTIVHF